MSNEDYLKERRYDARTILNYFSNNPDKLEKIINKYHPELSEFLYDSPASDVENDFINYTYDLIKKYEKNKE